MKRNVRLWAVGLAASLLLGAVSPLAVAPSASADGASSVTIDTVSPSSGLVVGRSFIEIAGSGFGSSSATVSLGDLELLVTSVTDTLITAKIPARTGASRLDGEFDLTVTVGAATATKSNAYEFLPAGEFWVGDYAPGSAIFRTANHFWRGYSFELQNDIEITGLTGGGACSMGLTLFEADLVNVKTPEEKPVLRPRVKKVVIPEVTISASTTSVSSGTLLPAAVQARVTTMPVPTTLVKANDDKGAPVTYYLAQRGLGSSCHFGTDSVTRDDLVRNTAALFSNWYPSADGGAIRLRNSTAAATLVGQTENDRTAFESLDSTRTLVGFTYNTDVTLPVVETSDEPLSGLLQSTGGGATSVDIRFGRTVDNESAPTLITDEQISAGGQVGSGESNVLVQGLTTDLLAGTKYYYRIVAQNLAGQSLGAIKSFTTLGLPGTPLVSGAPGDGEARLTVTPADSPGTQTTTSYRYRYRVGDGSWTEAIRTPASINNPLIVAPLVNGTAYEIQVRAIASGLEGADWSTSVFVTPNEGAGSEPPAAVTAPPAVSTPPRAPTTQAEPPGVLSPPQAPARSPTTPTRPPTPTATGPTLVGGQPPVPSPRPQALIGGVPTQVTSTAVGQTGVRLSAGTLDLGVRVNTPDQGTVRTTPDGEPELSVVKGQQTLISGSGVAPGSTVQAFLPLAGNNAVELGRIQADATGTFSGAAVLNTATTQAPLPVGRQVLQILGVDEGGDQTVINMTINIAQPPPQPEINRENQEVPALGVGQSLATEAGLPVAVRVIPVPENKQTLIEGDGWTMGVSVAGEGADVTDTGDGDVRLTLVRNETAEVSGSGFMPFTRADVWLFSEPTLLGTVDIDENGEFNGVVNVDGNVVAVGEHTLQLQGVGEDGYVRAANLGVVVGENPDLVPSPTATTSLTWLLWVAGGVAVLVAISVLWWWRRRLSTVA